MTNTEETKMSNLTREQVVEIVGNAAVDRVEKKDCGFTGTADNCDDSEFVAYVSVDHPDYEHLGAHYYVSRDELAEKGLDGIDWKINHYSLV